MDLEPETLWLLITLFINLPIHYGYFLQRCFPPGWRIVFQNDYSKWTETKENDNGQSFENTGLSLVGGRYSDGPRTRTGLRTTRSPPRITARVELLKDFTGLTESQSSSNRRNGTICIQQTHIDIRNTWLLRIIRSTSKSHL